MNIYGNRLTSYLVWRFFLSVPRFRTFVTNLVVPDEDVDINLFGSVVHISRRKEIGYYRAFKQSTANIVFRDEIAPLLNLALIIERGDTFVDIGANVGLYSAVLNRLSAVYPENRWYAFEANPDTAQRLSATLASRNVKIVNVALSNREGQLEFIGGAGSAVFGAKQNASHFQFGKSISMPTVTLDQTQILGNRIVVKVDVEGHEREVLEGGAKLFDSGRIKAVYVDGFSDRSLPEWLKARGMRIFDGKSLSPGRPAHSLLGINEALFNQAANGGLERSVDDRICDAKLDSQR